MTRLLKVVSLPMALFLILSSLVGGVQLKKEDVRATLDEMFSYHVEYRNFSPMLAKRSLKVYLEQFDYNKTYVLLKEVKPYLDPEQAQLATLIYNYSQDNLSQYEALNGVIQNSIARARSYRQEIERELIASDQIPTVVADEPYNDYATSEVDLKQRIRNQLTFILLAEKKNGTMRAWNPSQRQKLFDLWERRFARQENSYLPSASLTEHYLCMHVLKSVAKSLDAHTTYFSPEEAYEMRTSLEKHFEGIGVVLRESVDGVVVYNMIKGGPAERSGQIQSGDLLVEVDGASVEGASYDDVLKRLQGKGNNRVQIGLRHYITEEKSNFYRVDLKRERIVMQEDRVSYSYETFGDGIIGKIVLPSFYESGSSLSCEQDLKVALRGLRQAGELKGLVVDMRENSGGFLTQAVKVSGLFMSSGVVVVSKYAQGMTQYLRELDGRSYYNGPLVLLTSRGSASATEIVAQALQDYGIALVVGDDRTYGKGTIQYQTVTDPKATNFFKVTIGRYYTVSGRTTQIEGVKADIVAPTAYSVLPIGERYLEFPLKSDRIPSAYIDPLTDVEPRNKAWFEKNYIPNLQKKLSVWTQMLPQLKTNSKERIAQNKDYTLFLKTLSEVKGTQSFNPDLKQNWGKGDLQMMEAVNIVKDMNTLKPAAVKQAALLLQD